jgi:hypothetical protein
MPLDDEDDRYLDGVRSFNTAGPCDPERNYMLPPEPRLPGARPLIGDGQYFIVHAPRQTGKTTTLSALARQLTAEGQHAALIFSCECAEVAEDDYGAAELIILDSIRRVARQSLPAALLPPDSWPDAPPGRRIFEALQDWALKCPLPLILFFDEIDALRGESLRSVLRQLRNGFQYRAQAFPLSVALCGLRDVRDYKAASGGDPTRLGTASPFNIADDSLRLDDFTFNEVAALYRQRTEEAGQEFTPEAIERAFGYSQGQPWLSNALAREITFRMGVRPPETITADHVDTAKERLILARATHLDSLVSKLGEPRVRRVIEPILVGTVPPTTDAVYQDDIAYVRDLGLIAPQDPVRIANPIYKEVIARVLGSGIESIITNDPHALVLPDGRLDVPRLLEEFTGFWIENGEILSSGTGYNEAGAQLVFMAFLHRMVNGDGFIDREYSVGSGRIDLLVRRPYPGGVQREAFELKVRRTGRGDPLTAGMRQLDTYLDRFQLDTGTLVIFDRRPDAAPIFERTTITKAESPVGRTITLLRA